jgi:septal ring factor EnvC (AmiA/AmiB activator)
LPAEFPEATDWFKALAGLAVTVLGAVMRWLSSRIDQVERDAEAARKEEFARVWTAQSELRASVQALADRTSTNHIAIMEKMATREELERQLDRARNDLAGRRASDRREGDR